MKIKILAASLVLFFVYNINIASAELVVNIKKPFTLDFLGAYKIENTDQTIFENIVPNIEEDQIASWKIRFYCDKKMSLTLNDRKDNYCGKAVIVPNLSQDKNFSVVFENNEKTQKKFKFKLKAYNESGKWIHTETRNFTWK